jgi:NAD(P)-dependent dehydrogenase (short-subunit alcohol dehydrogenase family)
MSVGTALDRVMDLAVVPGFTSIGHRVRRTAWGSNEASLDGRVVVVTGATGGLGKATAHGLAQRGAEVVLVGRDAEKTARVTAELTAATGNGAIRYELADLSLMADIRSLARRLLTSEPRIDVLVNNAGVLFPEREVTSEGIERTLATNLLGHFLLTNLLIPRIVDSAPAHIINVSSGGMYSQRISIGNLQNDRGEYRGSAAYARTKRGQVMLTEMWAARLEHHGVTVSSMHPGWADTPGVVSSLPTFHKLTKPFLRTPEQGADTIVWLAAADPADIPTGRFWHDRRARATHRTRRTRETAEERRALWEALSVLAGSDEARPAPALDKVGFPDPE